jgi:catechol 2,3-dioxygenase-like lactoylglutathione lyase family enzyme
MTEKEKFTMKNTMKAFAHVGLYIKDIERSKKFYSDILGFTCICEFTNDTGDKLAFMSSGDIVIELIQHKVWMDRHDGLFDHIAMLVDDIADTSEKLKAKGIEFEADIYYDVNVFDKGVKYQAFRGPDGEHLEIYEIMK